MNFSRTVVAALVLAPVTVTATELDTTFGTAGRVILDQGMSRQTNGAIQQRDGKIVVVGITPAGLSPNNMTTDPTRDVVVARFDADGNPDPTFGGDGVVTIDFDGTDDRGYDIAEQPDGKLVIVGSAQYATLNVDAAIARLNPDGSLDSSFNGSGVRVQPEPGTQELVTVAIQNDGKLLVGGYTNTLPPRFVTRSFVVGRLLADGTPDLPYGGQGTGVAAFQIPPTSSGDQVYDLVLQPDGKVIAAGAHFTSSTEIYQQVAAFRLDTTGALDSTFGTGGISLIAHTPDYYQEQAGSAVALPNGSLLLAGTNVPLTALDTRSLEGAVLRTDASGNLDTTFGVNGWARDINSATFDNTANDLALDPAGNILVTGSGSRSGFFSPDDMVVSRLLPTGSLDPAFGRIAIDFSEPGVTYMSRGVAVLVQPSGRVVVVGTRGVQVGQTTALDAPTQRIVLAGLCTPRIQLGSSARTVDESATVVNLTVRRTCGALTGPVTVDYATTAGTASAGSDFTATTGLLTWAAGEPDEKTLAIQLPGDTADEPDEQFTVAVSNATGGSLDGTTTATVTITDDDAPPPPPATSGGNGSGTSTSGSSGGGGGSLDHAVLLMLALALCAVARRRYRDL